MIDIFASPISQEIPTQTKTKQNKNLKNKSANQGCQNKLKFSFVISLKTVLHHVLFLRDYP